MGTVRTAAKSTIARLPNEEIRHGIAPSSVSAHPFRRGGITHYLANDVPETTVSQRANVNPDVIEQHYDQRTAKEKMEHRQQYLDKI